MGTHIVAPAEAAKLTHRFPVLDALRGVAAVAVVMMHGDPFLRWNVFPHAILAVDFFFMLSGFVLTLAYQRRLDGGWPMKEFMKARAIRLYPMYGLALLLGFGVEMVRVLRGGKGASPGHLLLFLGMGVVMLPLMPGYGPVGVPAFPLNFPSWSLFSEVLANLLHGWFLRRRGWKFLVGVVVVSAAVVVTMMVRDPIAGGEKLNAAPWVPRVMMSYTLGMLLYRWRSSGRWRIKLPLAVVGLLLLGVMAVRVAPNEIVYDLVVIFGVFPVILLGGAEARLTPRMVGVATVLGQASYAVYVLHIPVVSGMHMVWSGVLHRSMEQSAPWSGMVYVVVVFGLALLLDTVYDLPVRGWLQRRFVKRQDGFGMRQDAGVARKAGG